MRVRLRGRSLVDQHDEDTARSRAGRAALEAVWTPGALAARADVEWRAKSEIEIVASWDVAPERPEVHLGIGPSGELRYTRALRWRDHRSGYVPFGADILDEKTLDGMTIPARLMAGWGHGTPAWSPFFDAEVVDVERRPVRHRNGPGVERARP